jgi:hypothetical protein
MAGSAVDGIGEEAVDSTVNSTVASTPHSSAIECEIDGIVHSSADSVTVVCLVASLTVKPTA